MGHGHGSENPAATAEQKRQGTANNDINTIMQLIPAGIILVLCLRRIALAAERKVVGWRRRSVGSASTGAGAAASMPFVARWLAVVERPLMKPVGVKGFRDWTWLQFILINLTIWSAVALNLCTLFDMNPAAALSTRQYLGIRTGRTSTARIPLVYALAGRQSVVTFLTGVEYHTVRTYHKLIGLLCFIEASVHTLVYVIYYVEISGVERLTGTWDNNRKRQYLQWGTAAVIGGLVCCLLGASYIRKRSYEIFLASHIAGAAVFLAGSYKHRQRVMYNWVWAGAAFWCFERVWRWTRLVYDRFGFHKPVIMAEAEVVNGAVLLRVPFREGGWRAGQHFYLYFWGTGFMLQPWLYGQSHPFTVANSPGPELDGKHLEFVVKIYDGTTRALARSIERRNQPSVRIPVTVEGPYSSRPQTEDFDRVLLFAGGSGITYPSSALGDIVRRGREGSAIREVKFVWVMQRLDQVQWIKSALAEARAFADKTGLNLTIDLYATQEATYTPAASPSLSGSSTPSSFDDNKKAELSSAPSIGAEALGKASLHYVRPDAAQVVADFLAQGKGQRNMVLTCGPTGLGNAVRVAGGKYATALDEVHVASFDC